MEGVVTYTVTLHSGKQYVIQESDYQTGIQAVYDAIAGKTPIFLSGSMVSGSAISEVEKGSRTGEYGPHLPPIAREAADVFQLAAGSPGGFWKQAFFLNGKRRAEGKPWLFAASWEWARRNSQITDAEALAELIDSEWEQVAPHNRTYISNPY
jgi:hypothetical protein